MLFRLWPCFKGICSKQWYLTNKWNLRIIYTMQCLTNIIQTDFCDPEVKFIVNVYSHKRLSWGWINYQSLPPLSKYSSEMQILSLNASMNNDTQGLCDTSAMTISQFISTLTFQHCKTCMPLCAGPLPPTRPQSNGAWELAGGGARFTWQFR